jgi:hypothetical protein
MRRIFASHARRPAATFAALASLIIIIGAPLEKALGDDKRSTPVTVVNPQTNPVPTSNIDEPGRVAYEAQIFGEDGCSLCTFQFPDIPEGHRLVIQHVSGFIFFDQNAQSAPVFVTQDVSSNQSRDLVAFFAPLAANIFRFLDTGSIGSTDSTFFDQPTLAYLDAGRGPTVKVGIVGAKASSAAGGAGVVMVAGYLLDCKANPCAPIAP